MYGERPIFDMKDQEILAERVLARKRQRLKQGGPLVGDLVLLPDGTTGRFSHDWGKDIQTSPGGSFYLGDGYTEFSGGLDKAIPKDKLVDTGNEDLARFWFFHHHEVKAHNGVYFKIPVPVYRYPALTNYKGFAFT